MSTLLSGRGDGQRPDVGIPDSSFWTAFTKPAYTGGSVARSPIVLATAAPVACLLPTRLLVLFDVSGSMAEEVAPGLDRLQATAHVGQTGLQLLADDSELGVWEFSTRLRGSRDWAERVPIAPLGNRVGSVTQRQRILGALKVRRKPADPAGRRHARGRPGRADARGEEAAAAGGHVAARLHAELLTPRGRAGDRAVPVTVLWPPP